MLSPHWTIRLVCALPLASLVGCYWSQQPYGMYGAPPPGAYTAPPGGMIAPGGPGLPPPGSTVPPGGGPTFSQPYNGGSGDWRQSPNSDAPFYDPNTNGGGTFDDGSVPNYGDPQDLEAPPTDYNSGATNDKFESPYYDRDAAVDQQTDNRQLAAVEPAGLIAPDTEASAISPIQQVSAKLDIGNPNNPREVDPPAQEFVESSESGEIVVEPAPLVVDEAQPIEQAGPNPYAYDVGTYRWLRGIVEFDEQDGAWHVMYSVAPEKSDEFGGDIALIDNGKLKALADGEVVLVEGRVDYESRDSYGKPRYHIEKIARLVPEQ